MVSAISGILYPVHLLKNPNSTPREQSFWTADVLVDSTIWFSFHVLFRLFHLFVCFRFLFYFCFVWQDIVPRLSFHLLQIDFARFFIFRKSHRRCSVKEVFLKISQNTHENTFAWATFKYSCRPIKKETLTQVFSSEFCETFKGTFF